MAKFSVTPEVSTELCRNSPGVMLNSCDVTLAAAQMNTQIHLAAQMNTQNSFGPIGLVYGSNIKLAGPGY